ncbi:TPM domain-containing protein [Caldimonas brevitalea]|uniref:TPM domain-containing protein n=1 Tax=Caldimonas brevitalea TaxID=413882 RepID=UPI000699E191
MRTLWARLTLLLLTLGLAAPGLFAQGGGGVLPVPALTARVIDTTGTLSDAQRAALESKLQQLETTRGTQLVVLMVPTTAPEDIAAFAHRVADTWKIGRREVGDGLLLVVAKNDRRMRIEVARALEGAVPDLAADRIIRQVLTPAFQAGDFAGGLNAAVDRLDGLIAGEGLPLPDGPAGGATTGQQGMQWGDLAMFLFIGVPVVGAVLCGVLGRKLGSLATAGAVGGLSWWLSASAFLAGAAAFIALILMLVMGVGSAAMPGRGRGMRHRTPIIWGGGFGGGGGGFGSGGGFSSGGGGSFGGGGASGGW